MYLTVCPNTALDRILFIDEWIAGNTMRTDHIIDCVGGKGLNSAVVLKHLNVNTTALGFFAGKIGKDLMNILDDYQISVKPIWVDGTTRIAHVIADKKRDIHSHVTAGRLDVKPHHRKEFVQQFDNLLEKSDYVIFGGSIPKSTAPDLYTELVAKAKKKMVPTLVDAHHETMTEAIKAKPDIVKMNWEEFGWTFNMRSTKIEELIEEAKHFYAKRDLKNLVITMSKEGILAITQEGIYLSKAPLQKPVNAAGAGDAVSSTLAVKLIEGKTWEVAMQYASAVSAAAVLTEKTGDVWMKDVDRILPHVIVEKIE